MESIPDTNFTRNNKFENISDIPIATKIYSFSKTFFEKDPVGYILSNIRNVRNEGVHRCSSILRNNEENEKLKAAMAALEKLNLELSQKLNSMRKPD